VAQILVGLRDVTGDVGGRDPGPELVGQPTADVIEGTVETSSGCSSSVATTPVTVTKPMVGAGGGPRPSVTC